MQAVFLIKKSLSSLSQQVQSSTMPQDQDTPNQEESREELLEESQEELREELRRIFQSAGQLARIVKAYKIHIKQIKSSASKLHKVYSKLDRCSATEPFQTERFENLFVDWLELYSSFSRRVKLSVKALTRLDDKFVEFGTEESHQFEAFCRRHPTFQYEDVDEVRLLAQYAKVRKQWKRWETREVARLAQDEKDILDFSMYNIKLSLF